jgi:hypothetical protein
MASPMTNAQEFTHAYTSVLSQKARDIPTNICLIVRNVIASLTTTNLEKLIDPPGINVRAGDFPLLNVFMPDIRDGENSIIVSHSLAVKTAVNRSLAAHGMPFQVSDMCLTSINHQDEDGNRWDIWITLKYDF